LLLQTFQSCSAVGITPRFSPRFFRDSVRQSGGSSGLGEQRTPAICDSMRLLQSLLPCFLLVFTWINAGQGLLNSTSVRSIYQTCSMSPMSLQPGCICKISGLQSRSDMNGHEVLVHHFVHNLGRFEVEDVTTGEFVRVKPENLILHDPVRSVIDHFDVDSRASHQPFSPDHEAHLSVLGHGASLWPNRKHGHVPYIYPAACGDGMP